MRVTIYFRYTDKYELNINLSISYFIYFFHVPSRWGMNLTLKGMEVSLFIAGDQKTLLLHYLSVHEFIIFRSQSHADEGWNKMWAVLGLSLFQEPENYGSDSNLCHFHVFVFLLANLPLFTPSPIPFGSQISLVLHQRSSIYWLVVIYFYTSPFPIRTYMAPLQNIGSMTFPLSDSEN